MDMFAPPDLLFRRFAKSSIDQPLRRKLLLSALSFFGINSYAESNRQKMISLAARGINPFIAHALPMGFGGVYPEFSFSILLEKTNNSIEQRAAKLAAAALQYRQSLPDHSLKQEMPGDAVADEWLERNLFGRVANLEKAGLGWRKRAKDCKTSSHIVVAVNGAYFKLDVIDGRGTVMAAENILRNINSIVQLAAQDSSPAAPYGVIATCMSARSADVFGASTLDKSIRIIDEAIFLLAIDNINFPADENEAARDLHTRNYRNRDYRKSLQLVVLNNGFSGATFNVLAEVPGVSAANFASWIEAQARNMAQIQAAPDGEAFCRLNFVSIDFSKLQLTQLENRIAKYACDLPLIKTIDAIGKDGIKRLNVSPDAFFHAAVHLAYYERFGRVPAVHSFAAMRGVKFGSVTRYLTTSEELAAFLENQTKPALLKAFDAHRRATAIIKSGDYPLYYALFYLYPWFGLRPLLGILLLTLLVPGFFRKHLSPDIWASNIPALPGVYCLGRFGILFKTGRKKCLAGHYMFFADHIRICFVSGQQDFLQSWPFDRALSDAMIKLRRILS